MAQKVSVASLQPADREGWMTKQGGSYKSWKKRWFVLKGTQLFYFKNKKVILAFLSSSCRVHCAFADPCGLNAQSCFALLPVLACPLTFLLLLLKLICNISSF